MKTPESSAELANRSPTPKAAVRLPLGPSGERLKKELRESESAPRRELTQPLGAQPATLHCSGCAKLVHSTVVFNSVMLPPSVLRFVAPFFECCEGPWINNMRVHRCPHCERILGRAR